MIFLAYLSFVLVHFGMFLFYLQRTVALVNQAPATGNQASSTVRIGRIQPVNHSSVK